MMKNDHEDQTSADEILKFHLEMDPTRRIENPTRDFVPRRSTKQP